MQTVLRRAIPEDATAIRHLVREAYAKWVPLLGREPMPMQADYDTAIRDHTIDLLYIEGNLAALIETTPKPGHLFIENVAVSPAYQRHGLGRQLLAHAEQQARDANLPTLCLLTNQLFENNIRLYESIGYHIDKTEPFKGGITVHMSKPLDRPAA